MRLTLSFAVIVGLGCGLAQPAWAQTKQNAWQRLTGIFKSKNQKDESKKEPSVQVRVSPPAAPHESRGVVFIEEPKATAPPQATGWAVPGARAPAATPAPRRIAAPSAVVQPAPTTPPKNLSATPAMPPRTDAPRPAGPPIIIESGTPRNQSKTAAAPRTAAPGTATPVNYPKAAAPVAAPTAPRTAPQPVAQRATPTKAVKAPLSGRDLTRLTRQIGQACPKAKNVKLTFTSATEVTLEMDVTTVEECNRHAEQIFAIRDLDPYRVNLKFNVPQN